jgi:hypothetical protein
MFESSVTVTCTSGPALTRRLSWLLSVLLMVASCRDDAALTRDEAITSPQPSAALIDLGSDEAHDQLIEGFFPPERVGRRNAPWSDGKSSVLSFGLTVEPRPYVLAFLAEPYFMIQPLRVSLSLNGKPVGDSEVNAGWNAYSLLVDPGLARNGDNRLAFHYSRTARPSDLDPTSPDTREISVRIDQVQFQPIGERVELSFRMNNALSRAAMGAGWAIDPNDRFAGVWTLGPRALVSVRLATPAVSAAYTLQLTAHCQNGIAEQPVNVALNGSELGRLAYTTKRSTQSLAVPASSLREENEIVLAFDGLKTPAEINPKSNDVRPLGLRVLTLVLAPAVP